MGLKFVLGLIVLVFLIEMILTVFSVPIFGQDYTPIKFAEKIEEEVTRIAMDAGVDMAVIDPITEKIKNKLESLACLFLDKIILRLSLLKKSRKRLPA